MPIVLLTSRLPSLGAHSAMEDFVRDKYERKKWFKKSSKSSSKTRTEEGVAHDVGGAEAEDDALTSSSSSSVAFSPPFARKISYCSSHFTLAVRFQIKISTECILR